MRKRRTAARSRAAATPEPTRREVWERAATHALFGFLPVVFTIAVARVAAHNHSLAVDFHHEFWPAAHRVLDGLDPYSRSWQHIAAGVAFPYPALTALVFVPLALIERGAADWIATVAMVAAALLTLRVLRVRDWRLYGMVLLWGPVVQAWTTANLTLVLGLGIACMWRWRDRPVPTGITFAVLVSLKPFVWPLGLWLLATRRYAALGWTAAVGVAVNIAAWSAIGFGDLAAYRHLDAAVTDAMYRQAYTLVALCVRLGTSTAVAYGLAALAAAAVGLLCVLAGRRRRDAGALTLAIATCLLSTPVQWPHYFALLIVPLAIARPRLSWLWAVPLLLWGCTAHANDWRIVVVVLVDAALLAYLVMRPAAPGAAAEAGEAASARKRGGLDLGPVSLLARTG